MAFTLEEAQRVISKKFPSSHVVHLSEVQDRNSYSYSRHLKTFILDLSSSSASAPTHTSFITISDDPNSLQVSAELIKRIHKQTAIPIPEPILDTSSSIISHSYLLTPPQLLQSSSIIPLSSTRSEHPLNPLQQAYIDLVLGQLLAQLHSRVQNDWFGPSGLDPKDASYSWQEAFVRLLEPLIERAHEAQIDLGASYEDVRKYLSRAIAFFLFDDVPVPSLIWFTGYEDDVYIVRPGTSAEIQVAAILPNLVHSIWGDPLLETFFMPPGPSKGIKEGYEGGGGESLLVFGRHKTKRLWYTLYLALAVLLEREGSETDDKKVWAQETLRQCTEALKDAPNY